MEALSGVQKSAAKAKRKPKQAHANAGLLVLLNEAAKNAGSGDRNLAPYFQILKNEGVADVAKLCSLDGRTLDSLLPRGLLRQLQLLIHRPKAPKILGELGDKENRSFRSNRLKSRGTAKQGNQKAPLALGDVKRGIDGDDEANPEKNDEVIEIDSSDEENEPRVGGSATSSRKRASRDAQAALGQLKAGEEANKEEYTVYECSAKTIRLSFDDKQEGAAAGPTRRWETSRAGPLKLYLHNETGTTSLVHRDALTGTVKLNVAIANDVCGLEKVRVPRKRKLRERVDIEVLRFFAFTTAPRGVECFMVKAWARPDRLDLLHRKLKELGANVWS